METKIRPVKMENGVGFRGAVEMTDHEIKECVDLLEKCRKEVNELVLKTQEQLYIKELLNRNFDLHKRIDKAIERLEKGIFIIPKDTDELLNILKGDTDGSNK